MPTIDPPTIVGVGSKLLTILLIDLLNPFPLSER
jgi:hypothetical protein